MKGEGKKKEYPFRMNIEDKKMIFNHTSFKFTKERKR
jgi:hypothetical protein